MRGRPAIAAFAVTVLVFAGCGSDDSDDSGGADDPTGAAPTATSAPTGTDGPPATDAGSAVDDYGGGGSGGGGAVPTSVPDSSAEADSTVMVASDEALGEYLVDGNGRTLYLFTQDDGTTTACAAECVANWPPMIAAAPVAGDGVDGSLLGTADGVEPDHVTYNGHLLYFFVGDITPGDTNGHGLPDWYAVGPAGDAIE